jgi:hypothetical protein
MALDPSIALGYQPPQVNAQVPQPLQQFGQIVSLRDMMAQQQLRGMQMQNIQSEMQDRQYKIKRFQDFQDLMQTKPDASPSEIYAVLGPDGTKVAQEMLANRKADSENINSHLGRLSNAASTVLNDPKGPNNLIYQYNVKQLMANKDLDPAIGNELLKHDVTDPDVQSQLRAFMANAMDAQKQQEYQFKEADNQHKLVNAAAAAGEAQGKQLAQGLENFARGIGIVTSAPPEQQAEAWANYLKNNAPPDVQKYYSGYKWGPDTAAVVQIAGSGKPEAGKTMPYPAPVTTQMAEITQANEQAKAAVEMQKYQPVAQSVMKGEQRLQDLPPDIQSKIAPGLIMSGYQGFGKLISDAERERLGDYDRALTILKGTQKTLADKDKRGLMGVTGGMITQLPLATEHKDLQSDLLTQQQELKKFITNGSLRGVNADTLNQMFPNIWSQPEHADHQIKNLVDTITAEKQQYLRDLSDKVIPQAVKGSAAPATAPKTETPQAPAGGGLPGKVHVKRPDGQTGYINQSALPAMVKQGYTQIP